MNTYGNYQIQTISSGTWIERLTYIMFTLSLRMLFKLDKRHCFMFSLEIKFDVYLNEKKPLFSVGRLFSPEFTRLDVSRAIVDSSWVHRRVSGFDLLLRLIASFWLCVWLQSNSIGFCSFLFTYSGTILFEAKPAIISSFRFCAVFNRLVWCWRS